jgi:hypothetical protein
MIHHLSFHCVVKKEDKIVYLPYYMSLTPKKILNKYKTKVFQRFPSIIESILLRNVVNTQSYLQCKKYVEKNGGEIMFGSCGVYDKEDNVIDWVWGFPNVKTYHRYIELHSTDMSFNPLSTPFMKEDKENGIYHTTLNFD